jgi:hypothetical protein
MRFEPEGAATIVAVQYLGIDSIAPNLTVGSIALHWSGRIWPVTDVPGRMPPDLL